ncbi:hypothetical protein PIB30_053403 [Stylosanthes scabra]|uniref:Uncharacterized protein n=1 Tax=Stylosanthes scabra TaxID=79078 RepID=A0ABU6VJF4_9FABA|nr:hypothetical protein [Stylosanthes scabra]
MAKKKSCQNVRNPRVLSPAERELYGWVDAKVFTQSSVLASEHLPELRREMRLTQDLASERDFVLEAAGPSDRLPFRALEDRTHFLWVYVELFTCLGVRIPFSDFQREVLTRLSFRLASFILMVGVSSALSNASVFTLGSVLLGASSYIPVSFMPPKPGNDFLFFRAYQGRRLFDAFEESIQEFKWHYFKVLPLPGSRPFWLNDEGKCLGSLGDLGFRVLAIPSDSLLTDMEKQSRYDRLKQKMAEAAGVGPRSVLPHVRTPPTTSGTSASGQAVPAPALVASPTPVPPLVAVKKRGSSRDPTSRPFSVEGEKGAKEDPSADLKNKGRKRKAPKASAEEVVLGTDSAWEHKLSTINRAFPEDDNFRAALDAGLINGPTREILGPLVPEQLLGTAQHLACQLTACLQVDVLMVERDSALAAPLLNAKIKSLTQELEVSEGERLSALARMKEVEEKARVQAAQLESCRSALEQE